MTKKIYLSIMIILMCVLVYSGYKIYSIYTEYDQGETVYEDLVEEFEEEATDDAPVEREEIDSEIKFKVDFDALKKENEDTIGWIYSPNTVINYPVVQGEDNSYYLKHLFNGKKNSAGTPFLDYHMASDFSEKNNFIYAHHMKNGTMFSSLTKYKEMEYYKAHKNIYLITPKQKYRLEVFSAYITKPTSDTYMRGFSENDNFKKYIKYITDLSLINTGVKVDIKDKIVSLSTCTYEYKDARFVVHTKAVKIK